MGKGLLFVGAALLAVIAPLWADERTEPTSHYLKKIHKGGLALEGIVPYVLTPRVKEPHPVPRPDCRLVCGDGTYVKNIKPYLVAMGEMALAAPDDAPLARSAANSLSTEWRKLLDIAGKPATSPPLRVVTKHYARDTLAGRCVTIHVAFVTVRDPFLDDGGLTVELMKRVEGRTRKGAIVEFRKTYQIEGKTRRLIEAGFEVSFPVVAVFRRAGFPDLCGDARIAPFRGDPNIGGHFHLYGGGVRYGWIWYDLSSGRGKVRPWSAAYRIERSAPKQKPTVQTETLAPGLVKKLQNLVERA